MQKEITIVEVRLAIALSRVEKRGWWEGHGGLPRSSSCLVERFQTRCLQSWI